jgi:hypothetical protein
MRALWRGGRRLLRRDAAADIATRRDMRSIQSHPHTHQTRRAQLCEGQHRVPRRAHVVDILRDLVLGFLDPQWCLQPRQQQRGLDDLLVQRRQHAVDAEVAGGGVLLPLATYGRCTVSQSTPSNPSNPSKALVGQRRVFCFVLFLFFCHGPPAAVWTQLHCTDAFAHQPGGRGACRSPPSSGRRCSTSRRRARTFAPRNPRAG